MPTPQGAALHASSNLRHWSWSSCLVCHTPKQHTPITLSSRRHASSAPSHTPTLAASKQCNHTPRIHPPAQHHHTPRLTTNAHALSPHAHHCRSQRSSGSAPHAHATEGTHHTPTLHAHAHHHHTPRPHPAPHHLTTRPATTVATTTTTPARPLCPPHDAPRRKRPGHPTTTPPMNGQIADLRIVQISV